MERGEFLRVKIGLSRFPENRSHGKTLNDKIVGNKELQLLYLPFFETLTFDYSFVVKGFCTNCDENPNNVIIQF